MLQMPVDCVVDLTEDMKDGAWAVTSISVLICRLSQRDGCPLAKDVVLL